ncbi:MAG: long-chain fatty acid--CoA ligase, partial [Candidatus Omnitrophica bacterium]|nr:long-chain fatty acid--CoA ligase [Candidatus Omnitrophota bacterium]
MLPNLARMFFDSVDKWRDKTVIKYKNDGVYRDVSYTKAATYVRAMAHVLKQRGVKKGDKIAILSENRPEWWYADLATLSLGAVTVPIYATNSPKETSYILCDSEVKVLFVSTNEQLNHIKDELKLCQSLKTVIMFDDSQTIESFWRLVEAYKSNPADLIEIENIGPDDLATIIYTSGTTGDPKGVMLTHGNLLSNISASSRAIAIRPSDTLLSILPLSHVFERMGGFYLQLYIGSTVAFAENMKTSAQNLIEIGPTIVLAVPRFFEKVNENIWIEIRARGTWAVALFNLSIKIGRKFSQLKRSGLKPSFLLKCAYKFFDMLVFSKIKKKMGGHIRFFVSGGAPLPKDLAEFFHAIDILILEGYGLTETSPVIAANHEERYRFGSVGLPIENVQVKIAEDGEILIKGPNVMKGYYKHEAETRAVIHDGWFSTGDIGHLDSDNYLYITDRKKDLIKTSGGKYVS